MITSTTLDRVRLRGLVYVEVMPKRDFDKAASRFLSALRRTGAGLEKQRHRILDRSANAPRILPDSPHEVIDLTGDDGNDLDYYVYELARLRAVGISIIKIFGQPQELLDAQRSFEASIPHLRDIRNPLTHPNDNDELDEVAFFSAVVKLQSDGSAQYLVDPRYQHHDAAVAYHKALTSFLRTCVRDAIAADPPRPPRRKVTPAEDDGAGL
ncbi:hypothetical protein ACIA5G_33885 [Amycolatopsis sp. NPDC051758]|uniref:hypothetical protein n=1 Tax=Amycolatopsis sp. NPDC051758 TaxID=3363935 RepID=UPI0037B93CA0